MDTSFQTVLNAAHGELHAAQLVSPRQTERVCAFHCGIDGYCPTPLVDLRCLAQKAGVRQFLVKDESRRFGLNAFKALGGSFAIAEYICALNGTKAGKDSFRFLRSLQQASRLSSLTFITATDGNHGRGVAWFAHVLGCKAVVLLPHGSAAERVENIRKLGAEVTVTDKNYDDTVRMVQALAVQNGWVLVQDTSWDGYEDIPLNVMKGYTTLAAEIDADMQKNGWKKPTHLFLQAGVGSMAAAVAGYLSVLWGEECPRIIIVEPDRADCLFRTARANDGTLHTVTGTMDSMMAGLCCGEPCTIAWDILKQTAFAFVSCDDSYCTYGMNLLAKPTGTDEKIVSGESGAVTAGVAVRLLTDPALEKEKSLLELDESSRILVISTEGDTDKENYRRVVTQTP